MPCLPHASPGSAATRCAWGRLVARSLAFDYDAISAVSLDSVEATGLDKPDKRAMRAEFETAIAALRPQALDAAPRS